MLVDCLNVDVWGTLACLGHPSRSGR